MSASRQIYETQCFHLAVIVAMVNRGQVPLAAMGMEMWPCFLILSVRFWWHIKKMAPSCVEREWYENVASVIAYHHFNKFASDWTSHKQLTVPLGPTYRNHSNFFLFITVLWVYIVVALYLILISNYDHKVCGSVWVPLDDSTGDICVPTMYRLWSCSPCGCC